MATLLFSAVGTLVGGPIGGAIGALLGREIDYAVIGSRTREGPRLKELSVTTSSYGSALPRHFGRMRVGGTIIWATDLVEHREKQGGGKGKPATATYTYTASFAVALASRPLSGIGRVWADGNLLRGAAGDLKTGGSFRFYPGTGDQPADPLIATAEGDGRCPACRGVAYAVFESLQLADFGNRIPALTFEVFADDGALTLTTLLDGAIDGIDADVPLPGLAGISEEGALSELFSTLDPIFPMDCDAGGGQLTIARGRLQAVPIALGEAATSPERGDFGSQSGFARKREPAPLNPPGILRYYDVDRDYQPGLQRAPGRPSPGEPRTLELPAALAAGDARELIARTAKREAWARETLAWRSCELDPAVAPGAIVTVPDQPGRWRVSEWEWRASGIDLTLTRLAPAEPPITLAADPGQAALAADVTMGETVLAAFELPWDGSGSGDAPALFAAASSSGAGWHGAALYLDAGDGELQPLTTSGRERSILGTAVSALAPASPLLFDRSASIEVALVGADMALSGATPAQLCAGANRALLGGEVLQFGRADPLGGGHWRLSQLLRGRGGTEAAVFGHGAGERFVLLDGRAVALDPAALGANADAEIAALGLGDMAPVESPIACRGITLRPLSPVHGRAETVSAGALRLAWTRRARGAYAWRDGVDIPLQEETEAYLAGYGPPDAPLAQWETDAPTLTLDATTVAALASALPGGAFHVRQRGRYAVSEPLIFPPA